MKYIIDYINKRELELIKEKHESKSAQDKKYIAGQIEMANELKDKINEQHKVPR